jgi:tetratricopeptide (TPR) repeat protein
MLGGEPPFTGITPQALISKKLSEPTPRISVVRELVPSAVENALLRALAKTPADRFATIGGLAEGLTAVGVSAPEVVPAERTHRAWSRKWGILTAVVVGLVAALAVGWVALQRRSAVPALIENRVVVAPFENRTGDPSLDVISEIAADWIMGGLTDLPGVEVIPTQDALRVLGMSQADSAGRPVQPPPRLLASATGAALVITGSYHRRGGDVEFQSQMVDMSAQGTVLFSAEPIRGPSQDPLSALTELREQFAGSVASQLNVVAAAGGEAFVEQRRPPTLAAYRAYAQGRAAMQRVDLPESIRHLTRAIELDSTFIAAYGSLVGGPLYNLYRWPAMDSVVRLASGSVESMTDLERTQLDYMKALVVQDGPAMLAAQRAQLAITPSPWLSFNAAYHAVLENRPREAIEFVERSTAPENWFAYWYFLTTARHMRGDHRQELSDARRWRELMPNRNDARFAEARALIALGDTSGVKRVLSEISGGGSVPHILLILAEELRVHGHPGLASPVEHRVVQWYASDPEQTVVRPRDRVQYAKALIAVGRYDEAHAVVEPLVAEFPDHVAYRGYLGVIAARRGDIEGAQLASRELAAWDRPYLFGNHLAWRARIAAVLGDREEAVDLLVRAFAQGVKFHPSDWITGFNDESFGAWHHVWLHSEAEFESLRDYPPFRELIRPKG